MQSVKMAHRRLTFVNNWNNKLNCDCFSTIRLRNDAKYYPGQKFTVFVENKKKEVLENLGNVIVEEVRHFRLHQLNNFTARMDTGMPLEETRRFITKMYINKGIDWQTQELSLILCVKDKPTIQQTSLF